jgi:GntR family transcriptional repressor for pyruvate dehydrogenase complex
MEAALGGISTDHKGALTPVLVNRIRELIQRGELPLGSKLPPERRLAEMLGVSRASLRQAFKALESMGVVVSRVGVGNFIRSDALGFSSLVEPLQFAIKINNISRSKLFEMRQVLEVQVAGLSAKRASDDAIAAIGAELESMQKHRENPREMAGSDYRFHLAIIRGSGNEIFELLYEPISRLVWEDLTERMHLFDPDRIIALHRRIYKAIERRDSDAAMSAMKKHLEIGYRMFFGSEVAAVESGKAAKIRLVDDNRVER